MVRFRSIFFSLSTVFNNFVEIMSMEFMFWKKKLCENYADCYYFWGVKELELCKRCKYLFFTSCFGYSREIVTLFKKLSHFAYFCVFDVFTFIYSFNLFVDFLPVLFSALSKFWMLHIWTFEYESTSEYNTISPNWLQAK